MEVEAQTLPNFDPQSKISFSLNHSIESQERASSEPSIASNPDLEFTAAGFQEFTSSEPSHALNHDVKSMMTMTQECATSVSSVVLSPTVKSTAINGQETASCVSTAALKVQKVYRSYRTRRRLADSAVVAEEFWWQAINFARLNYSTISFFNFSKPETVASRWNRVSKNASKVGKGLSKDDKALKLAFQHWIEAIDPRHRYGHSLNLYYEEWCKTDAGQPFFYWLDIGDGREVDLKECPRSKLRHHCINYLGPQEREYYEYIVDEGKIVHKQTGELLDTTKGSQGGKWIFVMSTFKKFYAGEKRKGVFHHSSFLAGGVTLAAGSLMAEDGVLKSISAYSGHYRPTDVYLDSFLTFLTEHGVKLDKVKISSTEDYNNYVDSKSGRGETTIEALTEPEPPEPEVQEDQSSEPNEVAQTEPTEFTQMERRGSYRRTLSGGLRSPGAEVPKKEIMQRINSKKAASSYQLGRQLSLKKWSTGAGPRIGCIADYPPQVREQALEFVNLSPRVSPTASASRQFAGLGSLTPPPTTDNDNGDVSSV